MDETSLVDLGEVTLSELMVGGPVDPGDILHPTVGYTVSYGALHGYIDSERSFPPRMCQCRCDTLWRESGPWLAVTR